MRAAFAGSLSATSGPGVWRRRCVVAAGVFAAVGLAAALPRVSSPIDRLINVKSNGRLPSYVNLKDDAPIRAAARIMPLEPTTKYFLESDSTYSLDLYGATALYFPPALNVNAATAAQWIVAYDVKPTIPASRHVVGRYRIGDLTLAEIAP